MLLKSSRIRCAFTGELPRRRRHDSAKSAPRASPLMSFRCGAGADEDLHKTFRSHLVHVLDDLFEGMGSFEGARPGNPWCS